MMRKTKFQVRNLVNYLWRPERRLFVLFIVVWYTLLFTCEFLAFRKAIASCEWDTDTSMYAPADAVIDVAGAGGSEGGNSNNNDHDRMNKTRVVMIADPQLTDVYSYDYAPRGSWLLPLIQFYSDVYMRKAYKLMQLYQQPHAVFMLGDLFDGAKILTDEEYQNELERYNWVFQKQPWYENVEEKLPDGQITVVREEFPRVYNVSGNHDVGYRIPNALQDKIVARFVDNFGPLNYTVNVGGFTFVIISALTLEAEDTSPALLKQSHDFINEIDAEKITPSVLLTHVPLYRPPGTDCGPLNKQHGPLVDRIGYSYTNLLNEKLSQKLLEQVRPLHIFSGDDHDQCEVVHQGGVVEHTVGTFSWMQGVSVPSFAMVTLHHSNIDPSRSYLTVNICMLPSQLQMYAVYGLLFVVTVVTMTWTAPPANGGGRRRKELPFYVYSSVHVTPNDIKSVLLHYTRSGARRVGVLLACVMPFYFFLMWLHL